jgi:hypothetical protein
VSQPSAAAAAASAQQQHITTITAKMIHTFRFCDSILSSLLLHLICLLQFRSGNCA